MERTAAARTVQTIKGGSFYGREFPNPLPPT